MAHRTERFGIAVAVVAAMITLSACGGSPDPPPATATSAAAPTKASVTESARNKATDPQPVDQELIDELRGFVSPTGNVACMVDSSWARCDIIDRDWSPPPRPADCEFDYGQGITVSQGGPAEFICAGDTAFGPDAVLPYGESIALGPMRCESAESGITCRDTQSGHGFSISLQAYRLF